MNTLLNKNFHHSAAGFTLVELLVAMSIFSCLLFISFPAIRTATTTTSLVSNKIEAITSSTQLFSQIERIAEQSNSSLATQLLTVEQPSILPERLAATSPVLLLKDVALETALTRIKDTAGLNFCALYDLPDIRKSRVKNSKLYILQSSSAVIFASASLKKQSGKACQKYKLSLLGTTPDPGISSIANYKVDTNALQRTIIAIPVLDIFAYFLDADGVLRRYSFISKQSQPLLRNVETFELSTTFERKGSLTKVSLTIKEQTFTQSFFSPSVDPTEYLNLLLL